MKTLSPILALGSLLWASTLSAAPAPPAELTVTDVSPKAFRAVWLTDPRCAPEIEVFSNATGTTAVPDLVLQPFPQAGGDDLVATESALRGLMSIEVSGLQPDTTYHFRARSRSVDDDSVSSSPLVEVRTARQVGLVTAGAPFTAFANPVVGFNGLTRDGDEIDLSTIITAEVPGARSPISVAVDYAGGVLLDLNNLISDATGSTMPVGGAEELTIRMFRGHGVVDSFEFFVPAGNSVAEYSDPQLTAAPLAAGVLRAVPGNDGVARVFVEFPTEVGRYYAIDRSVTLGGGDWENVSGNLLADRQRLFWEDSGVAGTVPSPAAVPHLFYRLREVDPADP